MLPSNGDNAGTQAPDRPDRTGKILEKHLRKGLLLLAERGRLPGAVGADAVDDASKPDKEDGKVEKRKKRNRPPLARIIVPQLGKGLEKRHDSGVVQIAAQHIEHIDRDRRPDHRGARIPTASRQMSAMYQIMRGKAKVWS